MSEDNDRLRPTAERQPTANSLRPRATRMSSVRTANTSGTARTAPYSLAGPRSQESRRNPNSTYVAPGYREINPEYEKEVHGPTFSLSGPLPRVVRGFNKPKGSKDKKKGPVGIERAPKGETEVAPQVENTDERAGRTDEQQKTGRPKPPQRNTTAERSSGVKWNELQTHDSNGEPLDTIGEEPALAGSPPSSDEETLAPEEGEDYGEEKPFNSWAVFRLKFRDELGEWLGTTILITLGLCANLSAVTSGETVGTYTTMYWSWGFATMLAIYISGGSSGAHLNPAISLMLSVYRGFPLRRVPSYLLFQLLGAFTGGLIAVAVYRDTILYMDGGFLPDTTGIFIYTQPKSWNKPGTSFFTEALGSGILSCAILALGDDSNSPPGAGMHALIIGLVITLLLMALGYDSSVVLNPVRDLGPRLAAMAVGYPPSIFNAGSAWWIWGGWGAPMLGSLLGAGMYDLCIFRGGESPINYSPRKWATQGRKAEISTLGFFGKRTQARDVADKLENGEV